jgi:hypothetical protein
MFIIFLYLESVKFDIAFWTEEYLIWSVIPENNATAFQIQGQIEQTAHDVGELSLIEATVTHLLFFDSLFECEVIEITEGMYFCIFDTHMVFYMMGDVHLRI